jgi:hypothetical protein
MFSPLIKGINEILLLLYSHLLFSGFSASSVYFLSVSDVVGYNLASRAQKKARPVFVVKEVLAKPKQKTKNNPRLLQA